MQKGGVKRDGLSRTGGVAGCGTCGGEYVYYYDGMDCDRNILTM